MVWGDFKGRKMPLPVGGLRYEVASKQREEAGEETRNAVAKERFYFPNALVALGILGQFPPLATLAPFIWTSGKQGCRVGDVAEIQSSCIATNSSMGVASRFSDYAKLEAASATNCLFGGWVAPATKRRCIATYKRALRKNSP